MDYFNLEHVEGWPESKQARWLNTMKDYQVTMKRHPQTSQVLIQKMVCCFEDKLIYLFNC